MERGALIAHQLLQKVQVGTQVINPVCDMNVNNHILRDIGLNLRLQEMCLYVWGSEQNGNEEREIATHAFHTIPSTLTVNCDLC